MRILTPKQTIYSAHRCGKLRAEELANISSYQTLAAEKIWKSY
jgi:hypothetical protein